MDIQTLGAIVAVITAGGTLLGVIFTFALNAGKAQQSVLEVQIKSLTEDRDFYRKELRELEIRSGEKLATLEAKYNLLDSSAEAERSANHNAIEGLSETVEQLRGELQESQAKRIEIEGQLEAAQQREVAHLERLDQMEDQRAQEQQQWKEEREKLQQQITQLQDNLAKLLPTTSTDDAPPIASESVTGD